LYLLDFIGVPQIVGADILELDAGNTDRAFCHLLEQVERMVQEDFGPLFPTMLLLIPLGRLASATPLDSGIAKEALIVGKLGKRRLARRAASACKSLFRGTAVATPAISTPKLALRQRD